jgi:D-alanyl-D-alanine carboxypeptidase/D-alanyl-D-alanine-endopeptidase (penicillin-binding protein 4)
MKNLPKNILLKSLTCFSNKVSRRSKLHSFLSPSYRWFCICLLNAAVWGGCSPQKQIAKQAKSNFFSNADFASAHLGISVFDPSLGKFLYTYQAEKYFTPASNTKLFSLYAGLKYLGDSLVAARYKIEDDVLILQAAGDPTFLHPDFKNQPLLKFLQQDQFQKISINTTFASRPLGSGWAWSDYAEPYMAERDPFPIYGNLLTVHFNGDSLQTIPPILKPVVIGMPSKDQPWDVTRTLGGHFYTIENGKGTTAKEKTITMAMERGAFAARYLADTLHKEVTSEVNPLSKTESIAIHSQPVDSFFKMMMYRSDNFFAEQTLQMVSFEKLGIMSDNKIIDTLLKTDLKDLPQKPKWVDGSGLSRYNLFTPKDFIWLLNKLQAEFSLQRLKIILPGANEGTLAGLYKGYDQHIYAKTGSLSNNVALSGYLITKHNKTLLFSVMVSNHQAAASAIRTQIEKFLTSIIDKY